MEQSKKVILIHGEGSKWYEQAIFIMRSDAGGVPKDFVKEAESIVERYLTSGKVSGKSTRMQTVYSEVAAGNAAVIPVNPKKKNSGSNFILNFVIVFCCVMLALVMNAMFFS